MEQQIIAQINFYFNKILGYVPEYKLHLINDSKKRYAGQAAIYRKELFFNLSYHSRDAEYFMTEVIGHEVAHIIQGILYPNAKQSHGPEFRRIMAKMGLTGNTFLPAHMINPENRPHQYSCGCDAPLLFSTRMFNKIQKMYKPQCTKCKTEIQYVMSHK